MMEPINQKNLDEENLTDEELMKWLKVGESWVVKNTAARRIPGAFKTGRSWKYNRQAIELQRLSTGNVLLPRKEKSK